MLGLVLRRARVQGRILTAVVLLVAIASTLVGVCTLLIGATAGRAFEVAVEQSPASDLSVTAFLVELDSGDITASEAAARRVVEGVLGPMRPRTSTTATSRLRDLDGDRQAYLAMTDELPLRADLVSGRWVEATGDRAAGRAWRRSSPPPPRGCSTSASATRSRSAARPGSGVPTHR